VGINVEDYSEFLIGSIETIALWLLSVCKPRYTALVRMTLEEGKMNKSGG